MGRIGRGDFFGERALIKQDTRAASCVAVGTVTCLTLNREQFTEVWCDVLAEGREGKVDAYKGGCVGWPALQVLSGVQELLGEYTKTYAVNPEETISIRSHMAKFHDVVLSGKGRAMLSMM